MKRTTSMLRYQHECHERRKYSSLTVEEKLHTNAPKKEEDFKHERRIISEERISRS